MKTSENRYVSIISTSMLAIKCYQIKHLNNHHWRLFYKYLQKDVKRFKHSKILTSFKNVPNILNILKLNEKTFKNLVITSKITNNNNLSKLTMDYPFISIVKHSAQLTAFGYGVWYIFTEAFSTLVPFGVLLIVLIAGATYYLKIPQPDSSNVEAIFGRDLTAEDLSNDEFVVRTIAHRGAGLDAPENTLAAFNMCKEKGCNFIEFDVGLTSDKVPVVFHDNTLERMTDKNIAVKNHTYAELSEINLSVKHPFKDRYPHTNIPTLDETINQLLENGQRMFIDLKDNDTQIVDVILSLFKNNPELYKHAAVTTFFPNLIYLIRRADPKIVCAMAWRPHAFAYESFNYAQGPGARRGSTIFHFYMNRIFDVIHEWMLSRVTYYFLGLSVILLHKDALDARSVLDWKSKGVRVMAWTVNIPAEKQFLAKVLKLTYLTDTLTGESTTHLSPEQLLNQSS